MPQQLRPRTALAVVAALALAAVPAVAAAHVHLVSSTPPSGANLDSPPSEVVLTFDGELDPAASGFTVVDAEGTEVGHGEVDLDVADRNVLRGSVEIDEPGIYTVSYRVLGIDGHTIEGELAFGYASDREVPAGGEGQGEGHESPDTALPRAGFDVATTLGLLFLALAGAATVHKPLVR